MGQLWIDNYVINTPLVDILNRIKIILANGKLKDIKPSSDGTDITVTCPNDSHANGRESSPDCHINLKSGGKIPYGWFHCFACDAKGPFVKFVSLAFSRTEDFAKKWLIDNYGERAYERMSIPEPLTFAKPKQNSYMDESVLDSYQSWHPYLAKRKLSKELCERFKVKYDPNTNAIVFPCFDTNGKLLMIPTRSIDSKIFYIDRGKDKPVYCLDYIVQNNIKVALVTEGPFDALTAYQYGFPAIATLGNLADNQIEKINKSGISTLYTMFDNDSAGRMFTTKLKSKLSKRIIVKTVEIPTGKKDINDLSYEEFWECLKKAKNSNILSV